MEVEADPNLLVVNLEHCVSSETRHLGKSSCIYTTTMPPNSCGHDVLQLATPVQCIGDINRIQHQHLTQLQPIQYPQVQVSYDNGSLQQPGGGLLAGGTPLYQAPPPPVHHYHPPPQAPPPAPPPQTYHGGYLTPLSVAPPSLQDYSSLMHPPPPQETLHELPNLPEPPPLIGPSTSTTSSADLKKNDEVIEPEPPPADDYQYYKEIERLLLADERPPNASPLYNKRLRKRAQNYIMIESILHHNPKEPRRVVMTKEEQTTLLESYHITASTGVHIGIKKMFATLRAEYFWRGMYVGVATYVRKCTRCRDSAPNAVPPLMPNNNHQEESVPQTHGTSTGVQTVSRIWTDVEIQLCGPYNTTNNRNSYVATIVDPESKFLLAAALPSSGLATRLTQFVLTSLFSFGFARAHVVTSADMYSAVYDEFSRRTRDLRDCHGLLRRRETPCCGWVASLLTILIDKKPYRWDRELDKFLYQFRSGELKQFATICANGEECVTAVCPFYSMFQRSPCPLSATTSTEDKENSFLIISTKTRSNKKKQMKKNLQIADCAKNRNKSLAKQKSRDVKTTLKDCTIEDHVNHQNNVDTSKNEEEIGHTSRESSDGGNSGEPVRTAVSSIKAFLAETRVVRQRRGNYNKYPDELRERMANYALKHGSKEAAKHFSSMLGTQVNDSTIRNLVKSRARFGLALRQDIAKFATEHGISEAAKHFSSSLNMTVSHYLIRRFKSLYGPKRAHCKKTKNKMKKDIDGLTTKIKNDIGCYANENSIDDTINHFRNLLGINLMESAVKKLQQDYLQKHAQSRHVQQQEQRFVKDEAIVGYNEQNTVCYPQSGSNMMSQNAYYNNVQLYQPQFPSDNCPGRPPENVESESGNSVVSQHYLLVSQDNHQTNYDLGVQEKVDGKNQWVNTSNGNANDYQQYPQVDNHIFVEVVQEKNTQTVQESEPQQAITAPSQPQIQQPEQLKKTRKKMTGIKKRGKYSTFSPELRAEIGKYAVEHGCLKASNHFSSVLGRDLPESTARGIKEKYLRKLKYSEVTSLGYSPRGRTPRLGKYDEMVQDCLKELIKTGERASSFLAIITARKILSKYEPNLLKENGGSIELNNSWAKSVLKRLGLRNNS